MGQCPIVRGNDVLSGLCADRNAPPVRPYPGIHHGDEHRILRPVGDGLDQPVAGLPDGVGGDIMGQIVDLQLRIYAVGHAVHSADRPVYQAKIRLKYQRFHGNSSFWNIIALK